MSEFKVNSAKINEDGNIVIQDITNSEIVINLGNPNDVMQFLSGISDKLSELPTKILNAMANIEIPNTNFKGLNVYLTVLVNVKEDGVLVGVSFGISITNLNKEIRYINEPYFKVSPPFKLEEGAEYDTFNIVSNGDVQNTFPIRLEFGEVKQISYLIIPAQQDMFRNNNKEGARIQAFVSTTVGELHSSEEYSINKLVPLFDKRRL